MTEKPIEYWRVTTLPDGRLDWKRLDEVVPQPDEFVYREGDRAYGELVIENDIRIAMIFTSDQAAHVRVAKSASAATDIANEIERERRERDV